jgi:fructokinase
VIVVVGEQVVDLVPAGDGLLRAALGGGPANTAIAAARLGARVAMVARQGRDSFGARFRDRLARSGVETGYIVQTAQPSALALATVDGDGEAAYDFWLSGAADFSWRARDLPELEAGTTIHIGSLAAFLPPGADAIERFAQAHRDRCTISFDPNLRQIALSRPDSLVRLERLAALAHVIRVSAQDLEMAYPSVGALDTAKRWLGGDDRKLIVMTRGSEGAIAMNAHETVEVPAPRVTAVDTIGAGDTATGALLAGLGSFESLVDLLAFMCTAAALNCTRVGADPPTRDEVSAFIPTSVPGRGEPRGR